MVTLARIILLFIGFMIYYAIAINEPRVQSQRATAARRAEQPAIDTAQHSAQRTAQHAACLQRRQAWFERHPGTAADSELARTLNFPCN